MLVEDEEENKRMKYGIEWWLLGRLEKETKKWAVGESDPNWKNEDEDCD